LFFVTHSKFTRRIGFLLRANRINAGRLDFIFVVLQGKGEKRRRTN